MMGVWKVFSDCFILFFFNEVKLSAENEDGRRGIRGWGGGGGEGMK